MRVPQVNERVKEAPASALRAMFAGIGSLLSVTDKIRAKPAAETPAAARGSRAPRRPPPRRQPRRRRSPPRRQPRRRPAAPEDRRNARGHRHPGRRQRPDAGGSPEASAAPEPAEAAALPLPNYDELSIASLRARLRNLSADQLTVLIAYEKGHADRADVISMFERRIAKLAEAYAQFAIVGQARGETTSP